MALGVFILCGCFNIKEVEFTCMATWLPYKKACVSIIDVLIIDFFAKLIDLTPT